MTTCDTKDNVQVLERESWSRPLISMMVNKFGHETGDVHTREIRSEPNNNYNTDGDTDSARGEMLTTKP